MTREDEESLGFLLEASKDSDLPLINLTRYGWAIKLASLKLERIAKLKEEIKK